MALSPPPKMSTFAIRGPAEKKHSGKGGGKEVMRSAESSKILIGDMALRCPAVLAEQGPSARGAGAWR